jgi:chemotaxis protein MotA
MNLGTLTGVLVAFGVFFVTVFLTFTNIMAVIDFNSILIVAGGTVGIGFICFPAGKIIKLLKIFAKRLLGKRQTDYGKIVEEISMLSKAWRKGRKDYETAVTEVKDLFLRDGAEALFWLESDISEVELRDLLETRAETHFEEYMDDARIFKTLGKFPPALGLMGTTLGLIALLQSIGGDGGTDSLGPAMAVALVTTLYGLFFSNFIFVPIAENLEQQTKEDQVSRKMVIEGIMMIQSGAPTKYIEEKVKSFILPSERQKIASQSNGASPKKAA